MGSVNTQATRSTLTSVDTTLSENITATQDYIPVASTTNFSTSVVAEIESTNEVVSFDTISENLLKRSQELSNTSIWQLLAGATTSADTTVAPDGTTTADTLNIDTATGSGITQGTINVSSTGNVTFSVYVQRIGGSDQDGRLLLSDGVTGSLTSFTATDTWQRISITKNVAATTLSVQIRNDAVGGAKTIAVWGAMINEGSSAQVYFPTTTTGLKALTTVTRGVNGTTAQAASSGDSIQQLPYALGSVDMPVRLRAISVSPDGTGAARLTLCDNNGDTLCDVDIPDGKSYTLNLPEDGIIFPNGVFVSNTVKITAYTVYTEKYSGPYLTS